MFLEISALFVILQQSVTMTSDPDFKVTTFFEVVGKTARLKDKVIIAQ